MEKIDLINVWEEGINSSTFDQGFFSRIKSAAELILLEDPENEFASF